MDFYVKIAIIAVASMLMIAILLQSQGSGLGATFGGDGNVYRTKRGVEKFLFRATIVFSALFFVLALASVIMKKG